MQSKRPETSCLSIQAQERKESIIRTCDVTLVEKEAKEKKDFKMAIEIANFYKNTVDFRFQVGDREILVVEWLMLAIRYEKNGFHELNKVLDLASFLKDFKIISFAQRLFFNALPLLPILINSVEKLYFSFGFNPVAINSNLANFIAKSKKLKKLWIPHTYDADSSLYISYISQGLRFNTSLENLDIPYLPIQDQDLNILLDSLASNPKTNLKNLNIYDAELTEIGIKTLEEFLRENKSIEWINTNRQIDSTVIDKLAAINKQNKKQALLRGATIGLFNTKLSSDLGKHISTFLSSKEAVPVTLACKEAARVSKEKFQAALIPRRG